MIEEDDDEKDKTSELDYYENLSEEDKIKELADTYNRDVEELKANEDIVNQIKNGLETEKTIDYLLENAKKVEKKVEDKKETNKKETDKKESDKKDNDKKESDKKKEETDKKEGKTKKN